MDFSTSLFSAMRLYHSTQVSQKMGLRNRRERYHWWMVPPRQGTESQQQEGGTSSNPGSCQIQSWLPTNTKPFTKSCYSATEGLLPRKKTELQYVLEHRQREQLKHSKLGLCPPSDLEVKIRARQQRMQVYDLEEEKRSESLQNESEFVRVIGTLKCIQTFS